MTTRLRWRASFCLAWGGILSSITFAQGAVTESLQLKASDPSTFAGFGRSVSIDGKRAIVGSQGHDGGGDALGSAYLFDVKSGKQLFKLTANDAIVNQRFGVSSAISGNRAIVGAGNGTGNTVLSGAAYVYDVATGTQLMKLMADDGAPDDLFGEAVAIDGNIAIVGASRDDDVAGLSGSAYLFDVTTGQQLFKLTATDPAFGEQFGISVAISGDRAIVGAFSDGGSVGAAYLFDVSTGQQLIKLTANDVEPGDFFGISVAIDGNFAIVGAYEHDRDPGSAYLFDVSTGQQLFRLTADDRALNDQFGWAVAIDGNRAVVGAWMKDFTERFSGSAYLFDVLTGHQLAHLIGNDTESNDRFGTSVAIDDNSVLVGSYLHSFEPFPGAGFSAGAAYLYTVPEPCSVTLVLGLAAIAIVAQRNRRLLSLSQRGC